MQLPPLPCYLVPLRPKYSPHHFGLKHLTWGTPVLYKRQQFSTRWHGVTFKKTLIFTHTASITSNITIIKTQCNLHSTASMYIV
jgi:hypothetical protein